MDGGRDGRLGEGPGEHIYGQGLCGSPRTPAGLERYTRIRSKYPTNKPHHPRDMLPGTAFLLLLPHPSSSSSLTFPPTPDPESHLPLPFPWPAGPRSHGCELPTPLLVPATPAGRAGAGIGLGPRMRPPVSLVPRWDQRAWPLAPGAGTERLLERRSSAGGTPSLENAKTSSPLAPAGLLLPSLSQGHGFSAVNRGCWLPFLLNNFS